MDDREDQLVNGGSAWVTWLYNNISTKCDESFDDVIVGYDL